MKNKLLTIWVLSCLTVKLAGAQTLADVPIPDMQDWEPQVREPIEKAVSYFDRKKSDLSGSQLGKAYGRLGMVFQARQINDATKAAFQNAMGLDPTDPHWPYYLGVYYEETGDFQAAIASYLASATLEPNYPNTYLRLGEVYLEAGELEKAQENFRAMLALEPGSAACLAGLGTVAERLGEYEDATDYLKRAVDFQPEATQLHYRLAQIYRRLGNIELAQQHLEKRGDRKASSVDPWIEVMKARRNDSSYYVLRGQQAMTQGNGNRALQAFSLALAIDPEDVTAMVNLATVYGIAGRKEDGEGLVDEALRLAPNNATALSLKGSLLEDRGQGVLARDLYRRAIQKRPDSAELQMAYASSLLRSGDHSRALESYEKAASLTPENANIHYLMGITFLATQDCRAGAKAFEQAVTLAPNHSLSQNALSRTLSTCSGTETEKMTQALEMAEGLYQSVPNGTHAETLAMVMARLGRFEEAIDYQTQAIFESLKQGRREPDPALKENMDNYQSHKPATRAYHPDALVLDTDQGD